MSHVFVQEGENAPILISEKRKQEKKKNHNLNKKKDIHLSLRLREKTDITSSFMNLLYNNDFTTTNH